VSEGKPKPRSRAKRISVFNHKGGVGKTTLTMNIAAALTDLGKRYYWSIRILSAI